MKKIKKKKGEKGAKNYLCTGSSDKRIASTTKILTYKKLFKMMKNATKKYGEKNWEKKRGGGNCGKRETRNTQTDSRIKELLKDKKTKIKKKLINSITKTIYLI